MQFQLLANLGRPKKRKKAIQFFKACPHCQCEELIEVGPDAVCSQCDWDSTEWDVIRGGMNNLVAAAREFGFLSGVPAAEPIEAPHIPEKLSSTVPRELYGRALV
jgi:hypothetical protein